MKPRIVPPNWQDDLHINADLDKAFAALAGYDHFFADGLRGWIRSLQLQPVAAWPFLDRALERSMQAPESAANFGHQLLITGFITENVLVHEALKGTAPFALPFLGTVSLPKELEGEHPLVRLAVAERKRVDGLYCLHTASGPEAAAHFESALERCDESMEITRAGCRIGLAAVGMNLAAYYDGGKNLVMAGREVRNLKSLLAKVHYSATMGALWRMMDSSEPIVNAWDAGFEALPCPEKTREVFRQRRDLLTKRMREFDLVIAF